MNSKKPVLLFVIIVFILSIALIIVFLFLPRPIIEDVSTSQIVMIQFNPYVDDSTDQLIEVTEYNAKEILTYLSNCKEQRTLDKAGTHWLGNVKLDIVIDTEDGLKDIILGKDSYSYESYGKPKYKILDADNLISALLEMINIEAVN